MEEINGGDLKIMLLIRILGNQVSLYLKVSRLEKGSLSYSGYIQYMAILLM